MNFFSPVMRFSPPPPQAESDTTRLTVNVSSAPTCTKCNPHDIQECSCNPCIPYAYALKRDNAIEEVADRLAVLLANEETRYKIPSHVTTDWQELSLNSTAHAGSAADGFLLEQQLKASPTVTIAEARAKMCEWNYQVVDHLNLDREVVSVSMSYLDRAVITGNQDTMSTRTFQLVTITALYLATKLYEANNVVTRTCDLLSFFAYLCRGVFASGDIIKMELALLESLHWDVHPPTPQAFCLELVRLVPSEVPPVTRHNLLQMAQFLIELSVCDTRFVTKSPSDIALAAMINAFELPALAHYKIEFLDLVHKIGLAFDNDRVIGCYDILQELYNQGEYDLLTQMDCN